MVQLVDLARCVSFHFDSV
ncbi:hypothetical protein NDJ44_11480 [Escherichia coli]|nr:hypothetical protein [Escherichia coli]MCP8722431.1 hypothetical protein [Escherichia coli]